MKKTELWELLVSLSGNEISLSEAHDQILRLFSVVEQSEQLCDNQHCKDGIVQVIYSEPLRCSNCDK